MKQAYKTARYIYSICMALALSGGLSNTAAADSPKESDAANACSVADVPDTKENREALAAGFIEQVPNVSIFLEPVMAATLTRIAPIQRQDFQTAAGYFIRYAYID